MTTEQNPSMFGLEVPDKCRKCPALNSLRDEIKVTTEGIGKIGVFGMSIEDEAAQSLKQQGYEDEEIGRILKRQPSQETIAKIRGLVISDFDQITEYRGELLEHGKDIADGCVDGPAVSQWQQTDGMIVRATACGSSAMSVGSDTGEPVTIDRVRPQS